MSPEPRHFKLKPSALKNPGIAGIKRARVEAWLKVQKAKNPGAKGVSPTTWGELMKGKPVDRHAVEFLLAYLNRGRPEGKPDYTLADLASETSDLPDVRYGHAGDDLWQAAWEGLAVGWRSWGNPAAEELAAVRTFGEVEVVAVHAVRGVGRDALGEGLSDADALAAGEAVIGHPAAAFAALFVRAWECDTRTVRWAVAKKTGGGFARCGVSAVLPLKADAFEAICRGQLDPVAVDRSQLQCPSPNLLLLAVSDFGPVDGVSARGQRNAPLVATTAQAVHLFPSVLGRSCRLAAPLVSARSEERADLWGYVRCRRRLGGKHPIAVMERPKRGACPDYLDGPCGEWQYAAFSGMMTAIQALTKLRQLTGR